MKLSLRFFAFIFLANFLFGCNLAVLPIKTPNTPTSRSITLSTSSPAPTKFLLPEPTSSSNAIPFEFNNQKVSLEFLQNDSSAPCINNNNLWKVSLKPEPFTLMVYGNKDATSILALKTIDLALPLQKVSGPLVTLGVMSNMFQEHDLYSAEQPSDFKIYDSESFFTTFYSPDDAMKFSDYLKNKLGAKPAILETSRFFLGIKNGGEPNYSITKINNKTIRDYVQNSNSMVLVVFIKKDLGQDFFQINWVIFNLEFQ